MKTMKKLCCLLLSLSLCAVMLTPAAAADGGFVAKLTVDRTNENKGIITVTVEDSSVLVQYKPTLSVSCTFACAKVTFGGQEVLTATPVNGQLSFPVAAGGTYTITEADMNVTAPTFDAVTYGYTQPEAKPIIITSFGSSGANISNVTVSDSGKFLIGGSGNTVSAGGSINTWTIQPAAGLEAGTHTATITVSYDGKTAETTVSFTVNRGDQAAPAAPELAGKTYNSITLQTIAANGNGAAAQYSKDNGTTWQDSPAFTGLTADTNYTFVVRYTAIGSYEASPASTAVTIKTDTAPVVTHTVNFNSQGGSAVGSQTVTESGKATRPTDPARSGYTFGGWYKESDCTTAWDFNTDTVTGNITLYAKWSAVTPPPTPSTPTPSTPTPSTTLPVSTTGQSGSAVTTTATPTTITQSGTATATMTTAMGNEIVDQAVAYNSENVVIAPKVTGSVTKTEVSIPASTVGKIGDQTNASLTVSTPVADVTIHNGGLNDLSNAGGTVIVSAEKTDSAVIFSVTAGGKAVESIPGGVTLTVPVSETTPGTVAVLVHDDGTREVVRKSVADEGNVTIPLDGSARLEIVDNSKYFADVPDTSWAADAVSFASAHELFNGTGDNQFSPDLPTSRGMLVVVLHNLESNPEQTATDVFADVSGGAWYAESVAWAVSNGIVGGYGNGQFGPNDNITREQLAVMLWKYAGIPAATDQELHFADADKASDWALEALCWATEIGVINGKGDGILDPTGQATRAEAAQMLKNFLENR